MDHDIVAPAAVVIEEISLDPAVVVEVFTIPNHGYTCAKQNDNWW